MNRDTLIQQAFAAAQAGNTWAATHALEGALAGAPNDAALLKALGQVHWFSGKQADGLAFLRLAADAAPDDAAVRREHARALWSLGRTADAAGEYEHVVRLRPREIDGWDELAQLRLLAGDLDRAWETYGRAVRALPGDPTPYLRWVHAAVRAGEADHAAKAARRALAAYPTSRECVENLCLALAFTDDTDALELLALHRRRGEMAAKASRRPAPTFPNSRDPDRLLRVAFYSGDFRFHACAFFLASLLSRLDRERVAAHCYALNAPDQVSPAFANLGLYREMREMTDDQIAATARADGIDLLIDCSGWSSNHRMEALCPRIAPVQIDYLGYSNSTGLPTMDYRVVDAVTDPPGSEALATERLLRLPGCFVCFAMPDHTPPAAMSPALQQFSLLGDTSRPITFGCFNRLEKAQARVLACWARILHGTPGSTLLLKAEASSPARPSLERRFAAAGGDPARLRWTAFEPDPAAHLRAHHHVDLALDPFPYNGTTTTCEALLMGVPVITKRGEVHRARVGASILSAVGLADLIAADDDGYVRLACDLARDRPRLVTLHRTTRDRMLASPVCNATTYAAYFEAALRGVWREWCLGSP